MATSQCCDNPPTLDPVYGEGTVVDNFGGLKAYISGSSDSSKPAILLVSDVFGTAYSLSLSFFWRNPESYIYHFFSFFLSLIR
jgi:hypothetical protein